MRSFTPRLRFVSIGLILCCTALVAIPAHSQTLIGAIEGRGGWSPPVVVSAEFVSPVRFIRLYSQHSNGPWGPYIDGYDYWTHDCTGVEFNVTGACFVNGVEIPPAAHLNAVNIYGECIEVYSWQDVVVDLGSPGPFTIELHLGNTVGTGLVSHGGWEIYESDAPVVGETVSWSAVKALYRSH
jgi:hypothetical protein